MLSSANMAAPSEKLENCEVCAATKAKYTCPKCEVRTCSLSCVNIHKKELDCDGIRDKVKFVPMNAFSDLNLLSDYRLLEEVGRSVDQLQRDKSKKFTRLNNLPVGLYRLKQAALKNNIKLHFMPHNFSRNKENTTFYNWKTKELFWRIEWIFQQAENTKWVTERALESTRLSELLEGILEPSDIQENNDDIDKVQIRRILDDKLQYYRSTGLSGIKVLLKAEKVKNAGSKFYELDLTLSIKENLFKKTIIEFPTFYIILKDHKDIYNIIDTDEEAEEENTSYHKRKQDTQRTNHKKKGPVNYFFDENLSEDEVEASDKKYTEKSDKSIQMNIPQYDELVQMEH